MNFEEAIKTVDFKTHKGYTERPYYPWIIRDKQIIEVDKHTDLDEMRYTYNIDSLDLHIAGRCRDCGERLPLIYTKSGFVSKTDCKEPINDTWKLVLKVPSGKIVFANDFRNLYDPERLARVFEINYTNQLKQCEQFYADRGLLHCFVGNTSPGIYQFDNNIQIRGWEEDYEISIYRGSICTDLWWISACDYDDFIAKGGDIEEAETVVDVSPGTYICESRYSIEDRDNYDLFINIKLSTNNV
jgi:hypothetical protein